MIIIISKQLKFKGTLLNTNNWYSYMGSSISISYKKFSGNIGNDMILSLPEF